MTTAACTSLVIKPPTVDYFDLVRRFPLVPVRDGPHLAAAHAMIDELAAVSEADLTPGQASYLSVLSDLTLAYEAPIADAVVAGLAGLDTLKHLLDEHGLTPTDVGLVVGQPGRGEAIVRGEQPLTTAQADRLAGRLGVTADLLR